MDSDRARTAANRYASLDTPGRTQTHGPTFAANQRPLVEEWRLDFGRLSRWTKRGWKWLLIFAVVGGAVGVGYGLFAPQRFTAVTDILVDPSKLQIITDDIYSQSAARDSQLLDVESKLRVLTSGNVLARVVAALNLQNDPEFIESGAKPKSGADPTLIALRNLGDHIRARREERSFVVTLSVWSEEPQKAVDISKAVVSAFLEELAKAEADGAGRTASSLMDRLGELRLSVNLAEEKVEAFRRQHGLQSSDGELVSSRSMSLLTTLLLDAQQRQIQAESRYRDLVSGTAAGDTTDAQQSTTMSALRAQLAGTKQQFDAQSLILGPRHPTLTSLRMQVESLENEIAREAQRLIDAVKSDMDQANSVLAALTSQSSNVRSEVSIDNQAEVQLRELERDATSKATIYEAFLSRAREVTERQQLDTTNIRIISPTTLPLDRSWPPRTAQLALIGVASGFAAGMLVALGLGLVGDFRGHGKPRGNGNG